MLFISFLAFVFVAAAPLCADAWKGEEYRKNSESQRSSAEDFMQRVKLKGGEAILDVGCGDGKITAAMAKAVSRGSVVGIDISPSMIRAAKSGFANCANLSFAVQDAAKINYDNQFDLITSFTVMQWVLDQSEALERFRRALKPRGRLWIQIPMGLPSAMQQALEKTVSSQKWKSSFADFSAAWRFYQPDEYTKLLLDAQLTPVRVEVVTKHEHFPSRAAFQGFLKQWFPYLRPLAPEQKEAFLTELVDRYLQILPVNEEGKVSFIVDRLEVDATK